MSLEVFNLRMFVVNTGVLATSTLSQDPEALKLHNAFVADMVAAEDTINKRNAAGTSVARSLELKGLPYNYLMPSSPQQPDEYPNITGRGIPYSISI